MIDFYEKLKDKLQSQVISSKVLLDKLRLVDEVSRKSSQYQDPFNLPFYYYLGKFISPKSVAQIGLDLGLEFCCFLQSNKDIDYFLGVQNQKDEYYSNRIAFSNIRDINKNINLNYYSKSIHDEKFLSSIKNFDLVIVNEKLNIDFIKDVLFIFWEKLNSNGILLLNYINYNKKLKDIYLDFCKIQNRDKIMFETRYGAGLVQK